MADIHTTEIRRCRDCGSAPVTGRAVYCASCRSARQRAVFKEYRRRKGHYSDPLPSGPPTDMDWLKGFSGWARSGMSYGEYQAAERSRHQI